MASMTGALRSVKLVRRWLSGVLNKSVKRAGCARDVVAAVLTV
jgi:hypothetical protein